MNAPNYSCDLYTPGLVPYAVAWSWQQQLVAEHRQNPNRSDVLIVLEHPAVYTLGQGATLAHLKFDPQHTTHDVVRIERGGEVTYHSPGQLVGYPILNLNRYQKDLHWYLRQLEAVIIETLTVYGLQADRMPGLTGVWVEGKKVAAIGIKVSRWITMHGFALNVCPDMAGFQQIVPCGIVDQPVASLQEWLPDIQLCNVTQTLLSCFTQIFPITFIPADLEAVRFAGIEKDSQKAC
jgi:lipoyl(octanoyl) transferase